MPCIFCGWISILVYIYIYMVFQNGKYMGSPIVLVFFLCVYICFDMPCIFVDEFASLFIYIYIHGFFK